jgi:hypothetical protein
MATRTTLCVMMATRVPWIGSAIECVHDTHDWSVKALNKWVDPALNKWVNSIQQMGRQHSKWAKSGRFGTKKKALIRSHKMGISSV